MHDSVMKFLGHHIRRDVINRVGLLDTNYDMGMWDDLDYNLDTRKLGYKTVLALDTCIYHRGRSTFNLIEKKEKFNVNALLKKNRAYLDSKWNPEEITRLTKS
jgi:GT2 family glycosyltransferase